MKYNTFVIIGRPGSGKSTQAKLLSDKLGYKLFSPGSRYREIAEQNTSIGRKVKALMDRGFLGPHWLSEYLFEEAVFNIKDSEGIILEGIGRRKEEAQLFHEIMGWLERDYIAIDIAVGEEEIVKRLALRRESEERKDDDDEDILVRIKEYKEHTQPAINFFESVGKLIRINGDKSVEEVKGVVNTAIDIK